jgi:hypothetical protein
MAMRRKKTNKLQKNVEKNWLMLQKSVYLKQILMLKNV